MASPLTSAAERIRLAMAPDPAEWFFTGQVVDHGEYGSAECTCDHPVRYQFFIARASEGKRLPIGSHCIRESVPFLIAAGAKGLARELEQAARRVESEQEAARRLAAAQRELPQLRRDFKLLREWCWVRRREWHQRRGPDDWMPDVLYRPPKLPAGENADEAAESIRRSYCSSWLAAVACALDEGFEAPGATAERQAARTARRTREECGHRSGPPRPRARCGNAARVPRAARAPSRLTQKPVRTRQLSSGFPRRVRPSSFRG